MAEHVSYWICSCGKSNLNSVKRCASCGKKRSRKRLYLSAVGVIFFASFVMISLSNNTSNHATEFEQKSQVEFLSVLERAKEDVLQSPNSLLSSEILERRDQDLTQFAGVENWTGTVRGVQRMQGKGAVSIEFNGVQVVAGVHLMLGLDTLVPERSAELYQSLLGLASGDSVQFSGDFAVHEGSVVELSYTGSGSLSAPEFLFSFSKIDKMK